MHTIIIGRSLSGKSTCGQILAANLHRNGVPVLVCDPFRDPKWTCDFLTKNAEELIKVAKVNRSCALFIDESSRSLDKHETAHEWPTTMARHWGHKTFILAQRAQQISATTRGQCAHAIIFRVSLDDAKILANEYADPAIREACELPQGEFFYVSGFHKLVRMRVDFEKRVLTTV